MICLEQHWDEQGHVLLSFFIQIIFRSEHFILLNIFLTGRVINLTGYVHFRNKLMSTNACNDFLCILIGWMQMIFYSVTPKAAKVNLLYHTSNRGQFLFHNLQICWVKSNMKFSFCAIQLILVCFWSNYTSAFISCIHYLIVKAYTELLHTHHPEYTVYMTYTQYHINTLCTGYFESWAWTWSFYTFYVLMSTVCLCTDVCITTI